MEDIPDALQSSTSAIVHVGTLPAFFMQWRSITSNTVVLNIVRGHQFVLGCCHLLFFNSRWFNIKAAVTYHPIIQKDEDKLLPKGLLNPRLVVLGFTQMSLLS